MAERLAQIILRIGLAFAFLFPPFDAIANPYSWYGYFPDFLHGILPDLVLLHAFGALEVLIALWVLSGWRIFFPSVVAALMLIAIVVFNTAQFEIVFRDLSIVAIALALAVVSYGDEARRFGITRGTGA